MTFVEYFPVLCQVAECGTPESCFPVSFSCAPSHEGVKEISGWVLCKSNSLCILHQVIGSLSVCKS